MAYHYNALIAASVWIMKAGAADSRMYYRSDVH